MITVILLAAAITLAASSSGEWPRAEATLRGSLGPVTRLHRPDGPPQAVAVLHLEGERAPGPVFVVLGPFDDARDLRLAPGARVVVHGRSGFIAGRRVLFASTIDRARGRLDRAVAHAVTSRQP